ncbi:PssD/Cps14F family polysaccharide biosynthesis glycosyltransferase [Vibrio toranzoniae]|uniref:PssD/Cps14F family polysaccharide biosynthesis glycosyltransferase n=1 Tax=Vibrio toranzoniae TaxID=1194427 RepID=UPI001378602F|nr:PssD/Cps14F family polysaccharide biosynthesis glycosyltransferase [Vibrio toranzoniae]NAZ70749.1 hypothetical protein [Vibrio toranzoniae]
MKDKKILFVFGEGGHREQMTRLCKHIDYNYLDSISMVDSVGISQGISSREYVVPKVRDKYSVGLVKTISNCIDNFSLLFNIAFKYKVSLVVSTGPGICILPSLFFRILGVRVVYIETWCRFETRSITGRIMHFFATDFYVQNKELLHLYSKAKYSGRL